MLPFRNTRSAAGALASAGFRSGATPAFRGASCSPHATSILAVAMTRYGKSRCGGVMVILGLSRREMEWVRSCCSFCGILCRQRVFQKSPSTHNECHMAKLSSAKGRFDEILELVSRGEYGHAESLCRALLQKYPNDVNVLGLRGAVLFKLNRLEEAEQSLRQTIRIAPTFAKPHEDLGLVLIGLKRPAEAANILRNAVRLDPELEL